MSTDSRKTLSAFPPGAVAPCLLIQHLRRPHRKYTANNQNRLYFTHFSLGDLSFSYWFVRVLTCILDKTFP